MAVTAIGMKLISLFSILIISVIFSLIPVVIRFKNDNFRERFLSLGNALAGGVFLGGGFSHLLPEAARSFEVLGLEDFPIPYILAVAGFLIVFLLEKVIFSHEEGGGGHDHFIPFKDEEVLKTKKKNRIKLRESESIELKGLSVSLDDKQENEQKQENNNSENIELEIENEQDQDQKLKKSEEIEVVVDEHKMKTSPKVSKFFMPIVLTLVLSVHSVIAGFAIGVQTHESQVLALFVAVIAHKWTESFALGVSLVKSGIKKKLEILRFVSIYSSMAPAGLILGIILSYQVKGNTQVIINAIISGIAAGTFIYIALIDILLKEFHIAKDKYLKYILCWIGFILITGSILLFDEDE